MPLNRGGSGEALIEATVRPGLDTVAVMHTELDEVDPAVALLSNHWDGPIAAYPHHGTWHPPHWGFLDVPLNRFVADAMRWRSLGVGAIGGCCGIRPAHIAALAAALDGAPDT
jgi:S-methylmethionine-dependent homocysteine/selenocysteine methylase